MPRPARLTPALLGVLGFIAAVGPFATDMYLASFTDIATSLGTGAAPVQLTLTAFFIGMSLGQLCNGPLSDKFGRRPVLLAGLGLMVVAGIGSVFAETLPQLIAARFFQALGGASGMVISRAIIRDLYPRERVGAMISLVVAALMIAQMVSPLTGGLLETAFGWRAILYLITAASLTVTIFIALALPETRRDRADSSSFRGDLGRLLRSRAFVGYLLCQVLASQIIFAFAGGGPYIVVTQMGRSSAEYGAWFAMTGFGYFIGNLLCVRFSPRHSLEKLIWFGLALQVGGSLLNLVWSFAGLNQAPLWLFGTQMIVMVANAFVMANSAAGAISIRPEAAGTASGAMGFLQQGIGSLISQFGAYLGGHSTTTLPLTAAIFAISIACACTMIFVVPRRNVVVSEALIAQAEEDEQGMM